jgi:hypothetical protein
LRLLRLPPLLPRLPRFGLLRACCRFAVADVGDPLLAALVATAGASEPSSGEL